MIPTKNIEKEKRKQKRDRQPLRTNGRDTEERERFLGCLGGWGRYSNKDK